jgi:hypothetical protein
MLLISLKEEATPVVEHWRQLGLMEALTSYLILIVQEVI